MARIDTIFGGTAKKQDNHPSRVTKWIHYSKLKDNPAQYRYGRTQDERRALKDEARKKEEALADLIEADGEVLQDLLVRKIDTDEYEIIAGHHRRGACRILVEERGKEQYAMLPCLVRNISDVRSEFAVYSSNGYAQKTDYEIMCEIEGMKHLLKTYPEEFPEVSTGRMVERLAQLLNMKKSTVGEYLTISKNLGEKGMELFQRGELKKSAAVALSGMQKDEQNKAIDEGITTHTDIKKYKNKIEKQEARKSEDLVKELKKPDKADQKFEIKDVQKDRETVVATLKQFGEEGEFEQPNLPIFRNNDQRKEWLRNYKVWGIWYKDENIGCTYYKYDFDNGARLIVETYVMPATKWHDEREESYFHLIGGPEPPKGSYGIDKWEKHKVYRKHPDSETALVEFLKYTQSH